jgi:hypothetical protein
MSSSCAKVSWSNIRDKLDIGLFDAAVSAGPRQSVGRISDDAALPEKEAPAATPLDGIGALAGRAFDANDIAGHLTARRARA